MKINIGKWFRRQVFGGEAVTLGSSLELIANVAGYRNMNEVALALISGSVTGNELAKRLGEHSRGVLLKELKASLETLQEQIAEIEATLPPPPS